MADPDMRERLAAGARETREELSWARTVEGFRELLEAPVLAPAAR
jgi:hypothetical protein